MNEITTKNGKELSREAIDLIRKTVAKDANDLELQMFLHVAKEYDLDPILKEIVFMKRKVWNEYKQGYDEIPTMMVSRDGLLAIAHKSGHFDGIKTETIMNEDGTIKGAKCIVYNNACSHPIESEVLFTEYCVYRKDKSGKTVPQALWGTKPATMIRKVAESQALRRAFNVKGVYSQEELEAEIQKDTKTELEYMAEGIKTTEALNDPDIYQKWVEQVTTQILEEITACETDTGLSQIRRKYEKEIGQMMDDDRAYILESFENRLQQIVSDTPPEIAQNEAKQGEIQEKSPQADPNKDLAEKEAFSQEFGRQAVANINACKTKAALNVLKASVKFIEGRARCDQVMREYIDAVIKNKYEQFK